MRHGSSSSPPPPPNPALTPWSPPARPHPCSRPPHMWTLPGGSPARPKLLGPPFHSPTQHSHPPLRPRLSPPLQHATTHVDTAVGKPCALHTSRSTTSWSRWLLWNWRSWEGGRGKCGEVSKSRGHGARGVREGGAAQGVVLRFESSGSWTHFKCPIRSRAGVAMPCHGDKCIMARSRAQTSSSTQRTNYLRPAPIPVRAKWRWPCRTPRRAPAAGCPWRRAGHPSAAR